jgi:hypothetical protein
MAQIGATRCEVEFEPLVLLDQQPVEPVQQRAPLPATARAAEPAQVPATVRAPA